MYYFFICKGGIAESFGISSLAVRLLFIFIPANWLIYIILTNIIPDQGPTL
ncbi:PspC domain-containing protein [Salinibacillus kushneri]|uniref:PspC domain-containing protein n=1 Tax=Salinibacillus kushneri TaxID=237682 RepID=UPI000B8497EF|nr:PspC domain-containing protein [Salinibacillus kushneri]